MSTTDSGPIPVARPWRLRWIADVVLVMVVLASAFGPAPVREFRPHDVLTQVLVLTPLVLLFLRRRFAIPVLAAALVLFGVTGLLGTLSPGIGVTVAAATFEAVLQTSRARGWIVTGTAVVAIVLLTVLVGFVSVFDPRALQFGLLVAFAGAAGDGARSRRDYIAAITERAERAERTREAEARRQVSEERLRIARDLHDAVAHQIAVISLNAGVASSAVDARPDKAKEALATIRSAARTVLGEIGDLMMMLRTDADPDAPVAPHAGLARLDELVGQFQEAGLEATVRVEGDLGRVAGNVDVVAYRVLQEALTNAHKHGVEHRAHVLLQVDPDELTVTVTNPVGPQPETVESAGLGLTGLRERAASVRGTVDAGLAPGGWRLVARLPLQSAREGEGA